MTDIVKDRNGTEYEMRWKDQPVPEPIFKRLSDGKIFEVIDLEN